MQIQTYLNQSFSDEITILFLFFKHPCLKLRLHISIQHNIMLQRYLKTIEFRKEVRKGQLNDKFQSGRQNLLLVYQQEDQYRRSGALGLQLMQDLALNMDREYVKIQKEQYPIEKFYPFLQSLHDDSRRQLAAVKLIEKYLYVGYPSPPQEILIDQFMRLLIQGQNIDVKKEILLILRDVVQDHYNYSSYLIENKKIVPKLLGVLERYPNNKDIRTSFYKLAYFLVSFATWHEDMALFVQPIIRMMHDEDSIDSIAAKLNILFMIAQLKPQKMAKTTYQKKIHRICLQILHQRQSRVITLYYLKLITMYEQFHLLKMDDVNKFIEAIYHIRKRSYQIGQAKTRYNVYEMKLTTFKLINKLLRSQEDTFREAGVKYLEKEVLDQLAKELYSQQDQRILAEVTEIILAYYYATEERIEPEIQLLLDLSINKCESFKRRLNLQAEYDYLITQSQPQESMEIQI